MRFLPAAVLLLSVPALAWMPVQHLQSPSRTSTQLWVATPEAEIAASNNDGDNNNEETEEEETKEFVSARVETASQTIDELTDAFLGEDLEVDDFLAAIEGEVDKIEATPPPASPQQQSLEVVAGVAKEGAAQLIKGVTAVAKEAEELVDTLPELVETLPNAKVGNKEDSMTYGEAADKMGKGAQGMWALASAIGGFVKESVESEIEKGLEKANLEVQQQQQQQQEEEEEEIEEIIEEPVVEEEEPQSIWGMASALGGFVKTSEAVEEEVVEEIVEEPIVEEEASQGMWGMASALGGFVKDGSKEVEAVASQESLTGDESASEEDMRDGKKKENWWEKIGQQRPWNT